MGGPAELRLSNVSDLIVLFNGDYFLLCHVIRLPLDTLPINGPEARRTSHQR
jgi:hypothetical protein